MNATDFEKAVRRETDYIARVLIDKNKAYGNSALDPVRIFSKADSVEQLKVRIDDKLSRLTRGAEVGEDTELDLIGYLVLLRIARRYAGAVWLRTSNGVTLSASESETP